MTPVVIDVCTLAVPLQVAVPLLRVALVGATVAPNPGDVMVNCVPLSMVFLPVNATVAVAPRYTIKVGQITGLTLGAGNRSA